MPDTAETNASAGAQDLLQHYGRIGIAAVSAALRYAGAVQARRAPTPPAGGEPRIAPIPPARRAA